MQAVKDEIISIEEIDNKEEYVYDLEVENNHTFIANGIFVHNTDSNHLDLSHLSLEDAIKKAGELSEMLSNGYVDVVKKEYNIDTTESFGIEFEKMFKTIIYIRKDDGTPAKKRYGAVCGYEKGKMTDYLYVRGFDMRRSDASNYTKALQEQVLRLILWDKPKEETINYVQSMIEGFKKAPIEDISIPKGISKNLEEYGRLNKNNKPGSIPAQIKGAIYSNKNLNTNFGVGSKIKYIYIKRMPQGYPPTNIISFEDVDKIPAGIEIDYDKMIDANIRKKVERILAAAEINWNDICGQKSLFDF